MKLAVDIHRDNPRGEINAAIQCLTELAHHDGNLDNHKRQRTADDGGCDQKQRRVGAANHASAEQGDGAANNAVINRKQKHTGKRANADRFKNVTCYNCQQQGHVASYCNWVPDKDVKTEDEKSDWRDATRPRVRPWAAHRSLTPVLLIT